MLVHLTENSANVEMNVGRVEHLQAVVNRLVAEVQIVIFNF